MFENKGDSSPPNRGRSPATSLSRRQVEGTASTGGSPQPLSKVRTQFVAIEKGGQIGLQRDDSGDSTPHAESNINGLENASSALLENDAHLHRTMVGKKTSSDRPKDTLAAHSVQAIQDSENPTRRPGSLPIETLNPASLCNSNEECRYPADSQSAKPSKFAERTGERCITLSASHSTRGNTSRVKNNGQTSFASKAEMHGPHQDQRATKPIQNPRKSANGISSLAEAENTSSGPSKPPLLETKTQSQTRFAKPKLKSPAKPVHPPNSLTATTASSVSKVNGPYPSRARQGEPRSSSSASSQVPSRINQSISPPLTAMMKLQESSASKYRPSLGPPSKKLSKSTSLNQRHSNIDEGLLARVMRPTQSSSSKSVDKTTPLRKMTQRHMQKPPDNRFSGGLPRSLSSIGFSKVSCRVALARPADGGAGAGIPEVHSGKKMAGPGAEAASSIGPVKSMTESMTFNERPTKTPTGSRSASPTSEHRDETGGAIGPDSPSIHIASIDEDIEKTCLKKGNNIMDAVSGTAPAPVTALSTDTMRPSGTDTHIGQPIKDLLNNHIADLLEVHPVVPEPLIETQTDGWTNETMLHIPDEAPACLAAPLADDEERQTGEILPSGPRNSDSQQMTEHTCPEERIHTSAGNDEPTTQYEPASLALEDDIANSTIKEPVSTCDVGLKVEGIASADCETLDNSPVSTIE